MGIALGIDIGTTKAAAVIYDTEKNSLLDSASLETKADIPCPEGYHEQDATKIFNALERILSSLDPMLKTKVSSIGVTGQMHGVILSKGEELSSLVTWKDARASRTGRLAEITAIPGCEKLKDGFGLTTLACLAKGNELRKWDSASTIHDLLVAKLCGLAKPVSDYTDAASWGLFNVFEKRWNSGAIQKLGIPETLLPNIVESGSMAGKLSKNFADKWGIPEGIPVIVALGDNQASILATANNPDEEIYLTLGTGAQLSVVVKSEEAKSLPGSQAMELRPFAGERLLAVSAPLCGGQAFAWLVKSLANFMRDSGVNPPAEGDLYARLDKLAMTAQDSPLKVKPNFLGERHDKSLRGEISNIELDNFTLGNLSSSLAQGILTNMRSMMPDWVFKGRKRIVASGNAMRKLSIMRHHAGKVFGLPVTIPDSKEEAACGAAIMAARH